MTAAYIAPGYQLPAHAVVKGVAYIESDADILVQGPSTTDGVTYTTAHHDMQLGLRVNRGCLSGTLQDFIDMIEPATRGKPAMAAQAAEILANIRAHFGIPE